MQDFPPTLIIRHKKENLKKCSLKDLEKRQDVIFYSYPLTKIPLWENYILLSVEAKEALSIEDSDFGLLLLDATWRYAVQMEKKLLFPPSIKKRKLPSYFQTAYPRCQLDCPQPQAGLASIEALFIANLILGRETKGMLDNYYWKEEFLKKNNGFL